MILITLISITPIIVKEIRVISTESGIKYKYLDNHKNEYDHVAIINLDVTDNMLPWDLNEFLRNWQTKIKEYLESNLKVDVIKETKKYDLSGRAIISESSLLYNGANTVIPKAKDFKVDPLKEITEGEEIDTSLGKAAIISVDENDVATAILKEGSTFCLEGEENIKDDIPF